MADEEVVEEVAEEPKSGGKLGLILMVVALLVAVGGGLSVYFFVIAPKFSADDVAEEMEEDKDAIPVAPEYYAFEQSFTNLLKEGDGPASTLIYQVNFECSDAATAAIVDQFKARFVDMLGKLHDSRTREEVDDILLFKESVQRQALQKSNDILRKIIKSNVEKEKDWPNYRITAVLHEKCMVSDAT